MPGSRIGRRRHRWRRPCRRAPTRCSDPMLEANSEPPDEGTTPRPARRGNSPLTFPSLSRSRVVAPDGHTEHQGEVDCDDDPVRTGQEIHRASHVRPGCAARGRDPGGLANRFDLERPRSTPVGPASLRSLTRQDMAHTVMRRTLPALSRRRHPRQSNRSAQTVARGFRSSPGCLPFLRHGNGAVIATFRSALGRCLPGRRCGCAAPSPPWRGTGCCRARPPLLIGFVLSTSAERYLVGLMLASGLFVVAFLVREARPRVVQGSAGRRSRIRPPRPTRELRRTGLAHGSPDRVVRGLRPSRVRQRGSEDGGAAGPRDAVSRAGPSPRRWYPGRGPDRQRRSRSCRPPRRDLCLVIAGVGRTHRPSAGAARTGPSRRRPASAGFGTTWTSAAAIRFFRSRRRTSCPAICVRTPAREREWTVARSPSVRTASGFSAARPCSGTRSWIQTPGDPRPAPRARARQRRAGLPRRGAGDGTGQPQAGA